ncbi:MAG TPA: hypothetical protein VIH59_00510 [Candidatus Tectomicrobia bacterium]
MSRGPAVPGQKPGRKPGKGICRYRQPPLPHQLSGPPIGVPAALTACPAGGIPVRQAPKVLETLTGLALTQGTSTQEAHPVQCAGEYHAKPMVDH